MKAAASLQRIDVGELERVLAQVREEKRTDLVLIGSRFHRRSQYWVSKLRGRSAYLLNQNPGDLVAELLAGTELRSLTLAGCGLGPAAATTIASNLHQLTSLDLAWNTVGEEGAKAIASNLQQLASLDLGRNGVGEEGAKAIASNLQQLTSLNLGHNSVSKAGVKAIANKLHQLTSLNLKGNMVCDDGAKAIASNLQQLTSLDLGFNRVCDDGAKAIANNLRWLTSLDLPKNGVGPAGAKAIANKLHQLTSLNLNGNRVCDDDAKAIANNLQQLTSLDLGFNMVCDDGAKAIANNLRWLTSLDLPKNGVGPAGAKAIANNLRWLTSLDLGFNRVGPAGAKAIASNLRQLTSLELRYNGVGEAGAKAIANNLHRLTSLDLGFNRVGDDGAKAIASNLYHLTSLDLGNNRVGNQGARAIAGSLEALEILSLRKNDRLTSVEGMAQLTALSVLDLSETGVTDLSPLKPLIQAGMPVSWQEYGGEGINVFKCPLVRPSPAVILRGREDVLNFFREIESQGGDRLYEAKALLVGKGGAGKTSLLRRLCHPELPLPEQDESTRGIEVDRHTIRAMGKLLPEHSLSAWCAGMAAIAVPAIGAAWGKGVLSGFQVAAAYLACGIAWTAWFLEKRRKARADASAEEERVADEEDRRAKGADKRAELECAATGPEPELRTIRIFLASSDELRADRDDFDLYFQHLNKEFFGRGLRIGIDRWEFSSDAMSRMRLQDEYNKKVEAADIFVSLFETKVGKFTEEEFDVAWRSFKDKGSPRIFTYFKKAYVPADPCSLPGLTTLERFQTKLKDAGHYWTPYETAEHLKRHFREQLAKLYPGQQSG